MAVTLDLVLPADRSIRARLLSLGLACCGIEVAAAIGDGLLEPVRPDDPDPALHVLLVAGTITHALAPAVLAAWAELPEPRVVVSFGACAASGGPYWDSYSVVNGAGELLPVTVAIPGCPPRPDAIVAGLALLRETA